MSELLPLAEELNEYTVTPGVLGFIVFAVLGVGVWILLKSMSKHLGRIAVPENDPVAAAHDEHQGKEREKETAGGDRQPSRS
ncbi:hypothetical protein [Streptomyces radicis]|uniref:Uncharacterized protein n=1 Tax=Streptomyces radicis TaxID=1750517 RepID=A0A3A9W414_9ACTN|nr:hypothetical protein [Streptomyces radicis]RKN07590.1 hypothetical protein D7319_18180 [Streptomyces radicis]RKN18313.1 hypothetical protein D7318_22415 [Streptomyces radicis]